MLSTSGNSFYNRPDSSIIFGAIWTYLPLETTTVIQRLPTDELKSFWRYTVVELRVIKELVDKTQSPSLGNEGGKDVLSILGRNMV